MVVYNVILRRFELLGKDELARKIDSVAIWIYPIAFATATLIIVNHYF